MRTESRQGCGSRLLCGVFACLPWSVGGFESSGLPSSRSFLVLGSKTTLSLACGRLFGGSYGLSHLLW